MAVSGELPAGREQAGASGPLREAGDFKWHFLRRAQWLLLANAAARFAAVEDRYYYFMTWQRMGLWEVLHEALRDCVRLASAKKAFSAAIFDAQSVKASHHPGGRGFDAGKKIMGRKRHLVVDTLGLILGVLVTGANVPDREGAALLLPAVLQRQGRLRQLWANAGYSGTTLAEQLRAGSSLIKGGFRIHFGDRLASQRRTANSSTRCLTTPRHGYNGALGVGRWALRWGRCATLGATVEVASTRVRVPPVELGCSPRCTTGRATCLTFRPSFGAHRKVDNASPSSPSSVA